MHPLGTLALDGYHRPGRRGGSHQRREDWVQLAPEVDLPPGRDVGDGQPFPECTFLLLPRSVGTRDLPTPFDSEPGPQAEVVTVGRRASDRFEREPTSAHERSLPPWGS